MGQKEKDLTANARTKMSSSAIREERDRARRLQSVVDFALAVISQGNLTLAEA